MRKFLQYSAAIAVAVSGALIACSETTAPKREFPMVHLIATGGNYQGGLAERTLPNQLEAMAIGIYNNPVRGVVVTFSVVSGGGSIEHSTSTTDSFGVATAGHWTLGTAGTQQVTARSGDFQAVFYAGICATIQACDDTEEPIH